MNPQSLVRAVAELGYAWPDAPSLAGTLGREWTATERRYWLKLLAKTYGRATLIVAYAIFGRDALLEDLSRIQPHVNQWLARLRESPSLVPLFSAFVRVESAPPENAQALQRALRSRGLQPAAWKWLCRQPRATVRKLHGFGWNRESIFWTNLLARACPRRLHSGWLEHGRPYAMAARYSALQWLNDDQRMEAELQAERFLRQLPEEVTDEARWAYERLNSVLPLSKADEGYSIRFERNTTWEKALDAVRRQQDYRIKRASTVVAEEHVSWPPVLEPATFFGINVRELTDTTALLRVGLILSHCVGNGGYTAGCVNGEHVIADLEEPKTGYRATLQLRAPSDESKKWTIGQLAGYDNTRVPQFFWKAAAAVLAQLNG